EQEDWARALPAHRTGRSRARAVRRDRSFMAMVRGDSSAAQPIQFLQCRMFPEVAGDLPLLQNLNPEQRAAVTLPNEHALILAGAGSGKTRVLTTRIAWLLSTGQVSPGGVMAVTFTNKAAKEMMTRLGAMLPLNVRGMWIGTFHGLCNRFLRAHYKLANLPPSFQILDSQDQLSAIKRLMKQHNVDEERFPARQTQWFIGGCKEDGLRPNMVEVRNEEDRKKVEIYQLYEEQCQREGVVDFGELMLRSYEVLRDNDPIREHYQRRQLGLRRRRRRPEHLRLPRRAGGQHGRLRARIPCQAPDQAGTELPQPQQHPGFGQPADQPQQDAAGQEL